MNASQPALQPALLPASPLMTPPTSPQLSPAGTPQTLKRLEELTLPEPPSYAPQTAGWIVVACIICLCAGFLAWRLLRRYRAQRYRRSALLELQRIERRLDDASTRVSALGDVALLLKRTAMSIVPRDRVAALSDERWIAFLRQTRGRFDARSAPLLSLASYAPPDVIAAVPPERVALLVTHARDWIRHHRAPERVEI
ncbi:DUF4381 domain-containing protein [Pararobbsia alpina]|uniref:DUF4381 domain-containing protein n=1 Tax=Pararobbsia alpina TaxID=621374 RepID=UPI0039A503D6